MCKHQICALMSIQVEHRYFLFQNEQCLYECEPIMKHFTSETKKTFGLPAIVDVPVCASYCDAWFDACKDDRTCVYNGYEGIHS